MKLLDEEFGYAEGIGPPRECKPDPEEMIQILEQEKITHNQGKKLIHALGNLNLSVHVPTINGFNPLLHLLGSIEQKLYQMDKDIERWKAEIDK